MSTNDLTKNSIERYANGNTEFSSVVQVVKIQELKTKSKKRRIKIFISDGENCCPAIVGKKMTKKIDNLKLFGIIKILDCVVHEIKKSKKFLVLLNFTIEETRNSKVGSPKKIQIRGIESAREVIKPPSNIQPNITIPPQQTQQTPSQSSQSSQQRRSFSSPSSSSSSSQRVQPPPTQLSTPPFSQTKRKKKGFGNPIYSQNPQQRRKSRTAIRRLGDEMPDLSKSEIVPVSYMNPHDNVWVIHVRVMEKNPIKPWNKGARRGRVGSLVLMDKNCDEISFTCFDDTIEEFYDRMEVGKLYYISRGNVKYVRKKYSKSKLEIHPRNNETIIQEDNEDSNKMTDEDEKSSIPMFNYAFTNFGDLEKLSDNSIVDIFGMISKFDPIREIKSLNTVNRQVHIVNFIGDNLISIPMTVWGDDAENIESEMSENDIIVIKNCRKKTYQGVQIGKMKNTKILRNPQGIEELEDFKKRLEDTTRKTGANPISQVMSPQSRRYNNNNNRRVSGGATRGGNNAFCDTVSKINNTQIDDPKKSVYLNLEAYLISLGKDLEKKIWYDACPNTTQFGKKCNKKMESLSSDDTFFKCITCDAEFSESDKRYIINAKIQDHSGSFWVTFFNDPAAMLIGKSPKELDEIRRKDIDEYKRVLDRALYKPLLLSLRVQKDMYRKMKGVDSLKAVVTRLTPMDFRRRNRVLLNMIRLYD